MPAPTNTSKATAMDIGATLPFTIVQDANDAGVTKDLWFSYTKQAGVDVLGALALGDSPYTPETILVLADDTEQVLGNPNTPIQFSFATSFQPTVWFHCKNINGDHVTAVCTFNVQAAPTGGFHVGDILITDDETEGTGFPAASIDPATGAVVQMVGSCPNGESADILTTGEMLLQNVGDVGTSSPSMKLYTNISALNGGIVQATIPYTYVPDLQVRAVRRLVDSSGFYFTDLTGVNTFTLTFVSPIGVTSVADTITSTSAISAISPNVANTVLYLSGKTGDTDSAIRQWNLSTHSYDADFAAAIAGYININGLLTMSDGRVVALYQKNTSTRDLLVKVYSAVGVELASRSFGSAILSGASRIFYGAIDPTEFWLRRLDTGNGVTYFRLATADLSTLTTFATQSFQEGVNVSGSGTPDRFGTSITCDGIVLRSSSVTTTTYTIRRQRRFLLPSSPDNKQMQIPTLELLMRTGIGLTPSAWDGANVPQGANPQVMMRLSKDGGKTWGPERWRSAGAIGRYLTRVRWLRATGNYRSAVLEFTFSDPVDWQLLAVMGEPIEGSS